MVKERGFQIDQERRNSNPQKSLYYADFFSIQKIEYLKISPPRGLANARKRPKLGAARLRNRAELDANFRADARK